MKESDLSLMYSRVFNTDEGRIVLYDILNDVGFFSLKDFDKSEDIARLNVGRRILGKCGVWQPANTEEIVKSLVEETEPMSLIKRFLKLRIRSER